MRMVARALCVMGLLTAGCVAIEEPPAPAPRGPRGADIFLRPDTRVIEDRIPPNATLAGLLSGHDITGDLAMRLVEAMRPVFDPRRLRFGNPYRLVLTLDGLVRRFEYHIDEDRFLRIVHRGDAGPGFDAELVPYLKQRAEIALRGEIDFNNDLRLGDRFGVLFEKYLREDAYAGYGDVLAAEFVNDGRVVRAIRFTPPGGEPAYYDEQGRSLKRLFLRSPFRFEPRVTSGFSYRRLHPVLGTHRAHLGVDYGAPRGTPVIAVASGVVVSAGRSRTMLPDAPLRPADTTTPLATAMTGVPLGAP